MNRIQLVNKLQTSFWFTPALIVTAYVVLAIALIEIDAATPQAWVQDWPLLFDTDATGARAILSTVAGAMLSILGVSYSMTLVALVLASSQYSPRTLRNHMRSVVTKVTLGNFAGIFTYCIIVLRVIQGEGEQAFVPSMAVFFAFAMAVASVGVLIFFIHHIATSIQASTIIASIAQETMHSIEALFPKEPDASEEQQEAAPSDANLVERRWHSIAAASDGYLQSVDVTALLAIAREQDAVVRREHTIGEFLTAGAPLFSLAMSEAPSRRTLERLRGCYSLSRYRTVEQDPAFGIRQIVDIALKALSPGINDTSTAITCIDYLSAILSRAVMRSFPQWQRGADGRILLLGATPGFDALLGEAWNDIRGSAGGNTAVIVRMAHAIEVVGSKTDRPPRIAALGDHLDRLSELAEATIRASSDRSVVRDRLRRAQAFLHRSSKEDQVPALPTPLPTA